mgnify:FL=1
MGRFPSRKNKLNPDECPYAVCARREKMKLNEALGLAGNEITQVKKIADQASKVIISGIDKLSSKAQPNMADEFEYYNLVKNMLDKRFEQILRKRFERQSGF